MRVRLIAVGSRMPKWVREAYEDYITRLASGLKVTLVEIEPGQRTAGRPPQKAMEAEGRAAPPMPYTVSICLPGRFYYKAFWRCPRPR